MSAGTGKGDVERVLEYVARRSLSRCGAEHAALVVRDRDGTVHRAEAGEAPDPDTVRTVLKQTRTSNRSIRRKDRKSGRQILTLPYRVQGAFTGALYLDRSGKAFPRTVVENARFLLEFLGASLENIVLRERILTDQLTGLCNSDYFKSVVGREIDFAHQLDRNAALVLLDIDNFARTNESHGRRAADAVLVEAASRIGDALHRSSGITAHRVDVWLESHIGRYGGDEFAFLLFDVTREDAQALTEEVLHSIRRQPVAFKGKTMRFTATAGIAMYPDDATDPNKLFIKAYHALYTAKVDGKNRSLAYGSTDPVKIAQSLDASDLGKTSRGRILASLIARMPRQGTDIDALLRFVLQELLRAVPADRARLVVFDEDDKPTYQAERKWKGSSLARTRSVSDKAVREILEADGRTVGILELASTQATYGPEERALLEMFTARMGPELHRSRRLHEATSRLTELEDQMRYGLRELQHRYTFGKIIGRSKPMQDLFVLMEKVCAVDYPVIIQGETGVGKELVSKAIHFNSRRRDRPFMPVNCAAISETLLESELFGHEKGAFTGADRYKAGLFELAAGGSLFVDEIEEMSPSMQKKLLRVLEEKKVRPVGGKKYIDVDVRVVASTNRPVRDLLKSGRIREDLYYRLSTFVLTVPPLRDRSEDIPLITEALIDEIAEEVKGPRKSLTPTTTRTLMGYSWPGNVRELRNEMRKAYVLSNDDEITPEHLSLHLSQGPVSHKGGGNFARAIRDFERSMVLQALEMFEWNISRAAESLGMARNTLKSKIKAYNLKKP